MGIPRPIGVGIPDGVAAGDVARAVPPVFPERRGIREVEPELELWLLPPLLLLPLLLPPLQLPEFWLLQGAILWGCWFWCSLPFSGLPVTGQDLPLPVRVMLVMLLLLALSLVVVNVHNWVVAVDGRGGGGAVVGPLGLLPCLNGDGSLQ